MNVIVVKLDSWDANRCANALGHALERYADIDGLYRLPNEHELRACSNALGRLVEPQTFMQLALSAVLRYKAER